MREISAEDDPVYTTAEVAERWRLTTGAVLAAIRDGRLEAYMPAGRRLGYRIRHSAVERWIEDSAAVALKDGDGR